MEITSSLIVSRRFIACLWWRTWWKWWNTVIRFAWMSRIRSLTMRILMGMKWTCTCLKTTKPRPSFVTLRMCRTKSSVRETTNPSLVFSKIPWLGVICLPAKAWNLARKMRWISWWKQTYIKPSDCLKTTIRLIQTFNCWARSFPKSVWNTKPNCSKTMSKRKHLIIS